MRWRDLGVCHNLWSAVIISEAARPAPNVRHRTRNGRSVTPAIGASNTREGSVYGPIFTSCSSSTRSEIICAGDATTARGEAGIDLEPDGVGTGIDEPHLGIDTLATGEE